MIAVEKLSVCPLLRSLVATELGRLAEFLEERAFEAGVAIVRQEDVDRSLYFLLAGAARVSRHGHDAGPVVLGAAFGEISLLTGRRRSATVTAETPSVVARLRFEDWQQLRGSSPALALTLVEGMAGLLADQVIARTDSAALFFDGRTQPRTTHPRIEVCCGNDVRMIEAIPGTTVDALLPPTVDGAEVVAALLGQRPVALATAVVADARVTAVTLASWEGREVWRRTAGLAFLAAARRVKGAPPFSLAHSVGVGRVVRGPVGSERFIPALEAELRRVVEADLPVSREQWTVEEARAHFGSLGWTEAARLLTTSRNPSVMLHGLDGTYAHAMGPALPTVGMLRSLRITPHPQGLLLGYGAPLAEYVSGGHEALAREQVAPRFSSPMQQEHERWLAAWGVGSIGAFNEVCVSGKVRDLIRVSESFHEKHIGRAADRIAAEVGGVRVIAIAGPSSSGKTTFIKRLTVQLEVNGVHPVNLSLDDYYCDRERCPRDENGDFDFEALEALDLALLQEHIRALLKGETVKTAHFDFKSGRSSKDGGHELSLAHNEVLLIEGIHGLNPALLGDAAARDQVFRIFVQPSLCLPFDSLTALQPSDARFLRRIVRDRHSRGSKPEDNIQRWPSVRRGEGKHIFPHQANADLSFDTSLAYELSVLKVYGERYLLEVPPEHPAFSTAYRLRHLLDRFVAIYPDHVPPTSILREFIGGSGFEY